MTGFGAGYKSQIRSVGTPRPVDAAYVASCVMLCVCLCVGMSLGYMLNFATGLTCKQESNSHVRWLGMETQGWVPEAGQEELPGLELLDMATASNIP